MQSISVSQDLFGRLFNYGTLFVHTADARQLGVHIGAVLRVMWTDFVLLGMR